MRPSRPADVTVQTALLEPAAGRRPPLFRQLASAWQAMDPRPFLRAKTLEAPAPHQVRGHALRAGAQLQGSPGGLRDLQVVIWVARAAGLGKTWRELAARGLITPFEAASCSATRAAQAIRARLHLVAGRREDRLVFDLQTAVAPELGFAGNEPVRASEVLMRRYYGGQGGHAAHQILLLNIEERINGAQPGRCGASTTLPGPRPHAGGRQRRPLPARPARHPATFLVYQQTRASRACRRARCARSTTRAA
jgi:[protein-PII] uridylyltransferase